MPLRSVLCGVQTAEGKPSDVHRGGFSVAAQPRLSAARMCRHPRKRLRCTLRVETESVHKWMMGAAYTTLTACGNGFGARVVIS